MNAIDLFSTGRFKDAISAFQQKLVDEPDDIAWIDGLAKSFLAVEDFRSAIPLLQRVHQHQKRIPDSPGQLLEISCAHWCLEDRPRAMELAHELCEGIIKGSVNMAPDGAGGATFGLVLHYMAATAGNDAERDYAVDYLQKLNVKYDKHPHRYFYPKHTVKQLLGEMSFEDALEGATHTQEGQTTTRNLTAAYRAAEINLTIKHRLGQVLFHDGAIRRAQGDEAGCMSRMKDVFALGYQTESIRWYLARHEVQGR